MARKQDTELKTKIRALRASGKTIKWLMENFHLSRNTIFYHLRENKDVDGREHYTDLERLTFARMGSEELQEEALRRGVTFTALQRVAYRTRKKMGDRQTQTIQRRVNLRGYLDFGMESELIAFGLSHVELELARKRLSVFRLTLEAPNKIVAPDGRYVALRLDFQIALIKDPVGVVRANAEKIKKAWRR
jgi:hypothetical protein